MAGNAHCLVDYNQLLSVVYLVTERDREQWVQEFLDCFVGTGIEPIRCEGILGDLQTARINSFGVATGKYVFAPDCDDIVHLDQIKQCVDFLEANPDYGLCWTRERMIEAKTKKVLRESYPVDQFNVVHARLDPGYIHNGVVFRRSCLEAVIPLFNNLNFYLFDWAIRLAVIERYNAKQLNMFGYDYRWHEYGHRVGKVGDGIIPRHETLKQLMANNIIKAIDCPI